MTKKIYYANTVEAALALARREHGDETLFIDSGETHGEERHLGAQRVVIGYEEAPAPATFAALAAPAAPAAAGAPAAPASPAASIESSALNLELKRLSTVVGQLAAGMYASTGVPELGAVTSALAASDLPAELGRSLLERVERRLKLRERDTPAAAGLVRQTLCDELESRIKVDSTLGKPRATRQVVAFVGPPGAGKTSTLVKLAMHAGVSARRPTAILSTDSHRVAATDQLRSYAAILGLPFMLAETPGALARALQEFRQKDLVLVDTPGFGPRETECAEEWANMLAAQSELEVQLVLAATTRSTDLLAATHWWRRFAPSKLLFTRLDETSCGGSAIAAAITTGLPVSYLCAGQRIPEDLEPATKGALVQMLLGGPLAAGAAA
jgi:flagellar biosynthesis protein FlhF